MPVQRHRGSYAKLICLNCRTRKIKCVLPEYVEIHPSDQPQPERTSCLRCSTKSLPCIVENTILGRPSHHVEHKLGMKSSSLSNANITSSGSSGQAQQDDELSDGGDVADYLIVRPERMDDPDSPIGNEQRQLPAPMDKLLAMVNPPYLLATLLQRDKQFASAWMPSWVPSTRVLLEILDDDLVASMDQQLVWHQLYYPEIPPLSTLYSSLAGDETHAGEYLPHTFLLAVLCCLAVDAPNASAAHRHNLQSALNSLVFQLGHQTIVVLPSHRYTLLAMELTAEYRPQSLMFDRITSAQAVRSRLTSTLAKQVASDMELYTVLARLEERLDIISPSIDEGLMCEFLQWSRLCLDNTLSALVGQHEQGRQRNVDVVDTELLRRLLESGLAPIKTLFAFHKLLCESRQYEALLDITAHWDDLRYLENVIETHKTTCDWQRQLLRQSLRSRGELHPQNALAMSQLLDSELHKSYCWVSGSAMYYCVMVGAQATRSAPRNRELDPQDALQVSDHIIGRFAERTGHQQTADLYSAFLMKYGEHRMEDLELMLANFVACADNLKLNGIPYIPPTRQATCGVLFTVKDIMEGNAARMKGWGGLHDRAHMQLLLIRNCITSLESIGGYAGGQGGLDAVKRGCLWAGTARVLGSLHRLLGKWEEWNTLGHAKVCRQPARTRSDAETFDETVTEATPGCMLAVDGLDPLPDDLFFDWDLWLTQADE